MTGGREDVRRALLGWGDFPPGTPAVITVVDHDGTRRDVTALRTATGGWAWVKGDGSEPFCGVGVHSDGEYLNPRPLSDERLAQAEAKVRAVEDAIQNAPGNANPSFVAAIRAALSGDAAPRTDGDTR